VLIEDPDVPADEDDKCPFKGGVKFSISLGPIEYKVDCTTVEIGFTAGAAASLTWDFKNKRVTQLFVGVGVETGAASTKLGGKVGAQITFDSDSSVSDISFEASGSVKVGPLGTEASLNSGLVVGGPGLQMSARRRCEDLQGND